MTQIPEEISPIKIVNEYLAFKKIIGTSKATLEALEDFALYVVCKHIPVSLHPSTEWVSVLAELLKEDFRLESGDDQLHLSIIDRKVYPRIWQDVAKDNEPVIIAESVDNILHKASPLAEKDWIIRFEADTIDELLLQYQQWKQNLPAPPSKP
jgi:hypothetical protein